MHNGIKKHGNRLQRTANKYDTERNRENACGVLRNGSKYCTNHGEGERCTIDEYPFASTKQGGTEEAVCAWVTKEESQEQSRQFNTYLSANPKSKHYIGPNQQYKVVLYNDDSIQTAIDPCKPCKSIKP